MIFKVGMHHDQAFVEKSEYVKFREMTRKLINLSHTTQPVPTIHIKLPFMVQRNLSSFTKDLRRFMTSNSAILLRDGRKEDFIDLISKMVRNTKSSGHKIYFMILCFMGVEVFQEEKLTNVQGVSRIVIIGIFTVRSMMIIIMKRNQFTNLGCVEIFITKVFAAQLI